MDYCRIATPHTDLTLRRHHKQNPANCLNICVDIENDGAQSNVRSHTSSLLSTQVFGLGEGGTQNRTHNNTHQTQAHGLTRHIRAHVPCAFGRIARAVLLSPSCSVCVASTLGHVSGRS